MRVDIYQLLLSCGAQLHVNQYGNTPATLALRDPYRTHSSQQELYRYLAVHGDSPQSDAGLSPLFKHGLYVDNLTDVR